MKITVFVPHDPKDRKATMQLVTQLCQKLGATVQGAGTDKAQNSLTLEVSERKLLALTV